MINPPLEDLLKKVDSKYTLVVLASKRARELMQGLPAKVISRSNKTVTVALEEIDAGKILYERIKPGVKSAVRDTEE